MVNQVKKAGLLAVAGIWLLLAAAAWLHPANAFSDDERRPLAQFPPLSGQSLLSGKFMTQFEDYTLDQFPLRTAFRQLKAGIHYGVLRQLDNNGIYLADGYAAKLEYPLKGQSIQNATETFGNIYETYLKDQGSAVFLSIIPDKGYYLAQPNGYLSMDYGALVEQMRQGMPYASYVNLFDMLSLESYYYTDTHWRQEKLLEAASRLCGRLGVAAPVDTDFTLQAQTRPFYGVYYGQAALPMEPETLYTLHSPLLENCVVTNYETGKQTGIYDPQKETGPDLYEVFLSGPVSLLTIENPNAKTDRELIIFRDSFGSAITPLLMQGYRQITLIDIRYISSRMLDRFVDFHGQDVLFLYSTLVLNNSETFQ